MKHLEHINSLQKDNELSEKILESLPTIGYQDTIYKDAISIKKDHNRRYGLSALAKLIGEDEMQKSVNDFRDSLELKVIKKRDQLRKELESFEIIKR